MMSTTNFNNKYMNKCIYCSSISTVFFIKVNSWNIRKCLNCSVLYTEGEGKKDKKINLDTYDYSYIKGYKHRKNELQKRFLSLLNHIEKNKNGGRLLDIGCGLGLFMETAMKKSSYNWDVHGLEINKRLLDNAFNDIKKRIKSGNIENIPFGSNYFDCVTCFDVLEHSKSLKHNLDEISRVLKKDGILVIQSPNYKSLMAMISKEKWSWWSPPDHIFHFSSSFMINLLKAKWYEVLEAFTYEPPKEFLLDVKRRFARNLVQKIVIRLIQPLLLTIERIAWFFNRGGLLFIVVKKI